MKCDRIETMEVIAWAMEMEIYMTELKRNALSSPIRDCTSSFCFIVLELGRARFDRGFLGSNKSLTYSSLWVSLKQLLNARTVDVWRKSKITKLLVTFYWKEHKDKNKLLPTLLMEAKKNNLWRIIKLPSNPDG